MNRAIIFALLGILLLCGCMQMKTEEDCMNINPDEVLHYTAWGENVLLTDEAVVIKANVTCWNTAALGYVAKNDIFNATNCCEQIKYVSPDESDAKMLYREYVLCIDAVATRMKGEEAKQICEDIDHEDFGFERERCLAHAERPPPVCTSSIFALLALGGSLFLLKRK